MPENQQLEPQKSGRWMELFSVPNIIYHLESRYHIYHGLMCCLPPAPPSALEFAVSYQRRCRCSQHEWWRCWPGMREHASWHHLQWNSHCGGSRNVCVGRCGGSGCKNSKEPVEGAPRSLGDSGSKCGNGSDGSSTPPFGSGDRHRSFHHDWSLGSYSGPRDAFMNSSKTTTQHRLGGIHLGAQAWISLLNCTIRIYIHKLSILVGGFNSFEKYARQNGSFPQISGWTFQKYLKQPPVLSNAPVLVLWLLGKVRYSLVLALHGIGWVVQWIFQVPVKGGLGII